MSVMLDRPLDGWLEDTSLETRPLGDLWRMWQTLGVALLLRAAGGSPEIGSCSQPEGRP